MTAVAGETLRLKCPVAGYPIEEIKWERANRELPDDLRQKVLSDGTLMISSVQKKGDAGVYTCWARNKQGHSARRSGDVAVIGKASIFPTLVAIVDHCRRREKRAAVNGTETTGYFRLRRRTVVGRETFNGEDPPTSDGRERLGASRRIA